MESSEKIKRYKKMRATQQWLIKTCIHCMIIWSLLNLSFAALCTKKS